MTWLRKLWARWFCPHYMKYDIYDIQVDSCWIAHEDKCPGYKCKGCPLKEK